MQGRGYHRPEPERTTIVARALEATRAGRAVFPVRDKVPLTAHGVKDASRDRARVTAMFNAAPRATGYGIATGAASGIVVVDVDGPEAQAEAERRGLRRGCSGCVVRTGREGDGWHLYFTIPRGTTLRSRVLAPGLELKAEGAYVVGPGSAHPSGRLYTAVRDDDPSPAPEWILAAGADAERDR
ncbi:MAG TPA: bifunctional DNA primase/polymerase, partial [Rubrobacteraceae bacterium]|nr:bifunctional DNA primase/polymerase [Rubrobacteraceae bacterium]